MSDGLRVLVCFAFSRESFSRENRARSEFDLCSIMRKSFSKVSETSNISVELLKDLFLKFDPMFMFVFFHELI